ncbi:hypothetical protein J2W35_003312 [Variovorax boronicumulans]|uniref:hypothetical protein n=1 Tax=Variovorax boronicumulans TaxID=436515 RepID=UPI00278A92CF|nr:hypothetical protein [Variovorax boronicumulans]MDQ0082953.1 hypothetical protein [Variovorax boronicumulans]
MWLLWVFYAAVMRLKMVRDAAGLEGKPWIKVFGYLTLAVGLVLDFFVNVVAGTIVFRELPREWTLSTRLWRLSNGSAGWRQVWALSIRVALLDEIDPEGIHRG